MLNGFWSRLKTRAGITLAGLTGSRNNTIIFASELPEPFVQPQLDETNSTGSPHRRSLYARLWRRDFSDPHDLENALNTMLNNRFQQRKRDQYFRVIGKQTR